MGATVTGRISITNDIITKLVRPEEADYYLNNGWRRGRAGQLPSRVPCKNCNKPINPHDGSSGLCSKCYQELGYYKEKWKDPEYRHKVVEGATGKKRSDEFKRKQSENMKKYYREHPERRLAQGAVFSKAWAEGKHSFSGNPGNCIYHRSKAEIMFFNALTNHFSEKYVKRVSLLSKRFKNKTAFPDVLLFDTLVIEYNGDYFHANPDLYDPEDIVCYGMTAQEVWDREEDRKEFLLSCHQARNLDTGELFGVFILDVQYLWENEVADLLIQSDWDRYVRCRFGGYDEYLST